MQNLWTLYHTKQFAYCVVDEGRPTLKLTRAPRIQYDLYHARRVIEIINFRHVHRRRVQRLVRLLIGLPYRRFVLHARPAFLSTKD